MSEAEQVKLDASKGSKASMLLWVLAKRLGLWGLMSQKGLVAGKVRKKALVATARPIYQLMIFMSSLVWSLTVFS